MYAKKILVTFVGIVMAIQLGCAEMSDGGHHMSDGGHREAVYSGLKVVPQAVQIESLFGTGSADHFITHFPSKSFGTGPKKWNTNVYFGGRYSLTMQVDVEIDYSTNRIVKVIGEPMFVLMEHEKIVSTSGGGLEGLQSFTGESLIFGPKEWKAFFDSNGDFTALGLKQNANPVKFFKEFASSGRQRESISLTEFQADQGAAKPE